MKKFKELPFHKQVALVYFYSFILSLLLSPLFGKIFIMIFNPSMHGGLFPSPEDPRALVGGTLVGFIIFVSYFAVYLLKKNIYKVWFFGFILPFFFIANSLKEIVWAIFLTFIGWGLARLGLFMRKIGER